MCGVVVGFLFAYFGFSGGLGLFVLFGIFGLFGFFVLFLCDFFGFWEVSCCGSELDSACWGPVLTVCVIHTYKC